MGAFSAPRRVQTVLEAFYALESGPDVSDFVSCASEACAREQLLIRQNEDELELALVLPQAAAEMQLAELFSGSDVSLQLIEGVSHFTYVAERARTGLPATQLELELQAEVDKFVLLLLAEHEPRSLHAWLYGRVSFLEAEETETGERYRLANALAARFVARLDQRLAEPCQLEQLRRFYRLGQAGKVSMARA
jgi:hypothetical protein